MNRFLLTFTPFFCVVVFILLSLYFDSRYLLGFAGGISFGSGIATLVLNYLEVFRLDYNEKLIDFHIKERIRFYAEKINNDG